MVGRPLLQYPRSIGINWMGGKYYRTWRSQNWAHLLISGVRKQDRSAHKRRWIPASFEPDFRNHARLLKTRGSQNQAPSRSNHSGSGCTHSGSRLLRARSSSLSLAQPRLRLLTQRSRYTPAYLTPESRNGLCVRSLCPHIYAAIPC